MSNNKFKVLIVEDEANICSFIETLLTTNDYQALVAHTCTMGLTLFASHNPDLVILDLGLPDRDGLEFIRTVRQKYMTPIVVLSARTDEMDKIEALDLGANDYITKPFSLMVLRARVAVQLRQRKNTGQFIYQEGPFVFDFERMVFQVRGQETEFSKTEQRLLRKLIENKGATLKRSYLIDEVWNGDTEYVDEHALTVTVKRLRDKIEEDSSSPKFIKTVYGIGYTWVIE